MSNFSRRSFIKTIGLGTAATIFPNQLFNQESTDKRPNILFIMADDHAAHALSCYNSNINETPNLDRIANEGAILGNCFCTNSICAPSRASILTGTYNHINGVLDNKKSLDKKLITFPEILQRNGYNTALIGKYHLKSDPTGFNYYNILPGQGHYYNPDFIENGRKTTYTGYVTDIITDQALKWLKNNNSKDPFCLLYQLKAPHSNFMPGPKYLNNYNNKTIPLPETFFDNYKTRSSAAKKATMRIAEDMFYGWHLKLDPDLDKPEWIKNYWKNVYNRMNGEQQAAWDDAYKPKNKKFYESDLKEKNLAFWKYQRFIKDYLRCIDGIDQNVGRILDYLDSEGLTNNTIVIYTSDQGFFLGDHGWWDKRFMYEESIKMPFLIRYPEKIPPGTIIDEIILNIDFAPTILDLAGISIPSSIQGYSFLNPIFGADNYKWRKSMYYHYYEYPGRPEVKKHYGIRTKRYKLIYFYNIDAWELYDLKHDPLELNNLYSIPQYNDLIKNLKKELKRLQIKYKDDIYKKYQ